MDNLYFYMQNFSKIAYNILTVEKIVEILKFYVIILIVSKEMQV